MKVWRNDRLEEYSIEELHQSLIDTLEQQAGKQQLQYRLLRNDFPKLEAEFWTDLNPNRTTMTLETIEEREDTFLLTFRFDFPEEEHHEAAMLWGFTTQNKFYDDLFNEVRQFYS